MKIVFASSGNDMSAVVDPRFGRCLNFIAYDTESKDVTIRSNSQNFSAPQGAGIQAVTHVAEMGADCVVCGHCGPKAFRVLQVANIKVFCGVEGTLADIAAQITDGKLTATSAPNVEGHWM